MYFFENNIDEFQVDRALDSLLPKNSRFHFYSFFVETPTIPKGFDVKFRGKIVNYNTEDPKNREVEFIINIKTSLDTHFNELQAISSTFINDNVIDYLFRNKDFIRLENTIQKRRNNYEMKIKLKGLPRFNIQEEHFLILLCDYEEKLKELNNPKTKQYLISKETIIREEINYRSHKTLNQLAKQFDINSEDFLNALMLRYEY